MTDQQNNNNGKSLPEKSETKLMLCNAVTPNINSLPLDKKFNVATPDGLISECGITELQEYMFNNGLGELPNDFEPVWLTNRGTLPKRLTSHCYKVHKIKVTTEQISEIGNIARRHSSKGKTYTLDFTSTIDWADGEFGDDGSCFWGSNSAAKDMIEANGYAVRAYQQRITGQTNDGLPIMRERGCARAWIAPIGNDRLILFNGYGETSLDLARVLSIYFGCTYKKIVLQNNGSDSGLLYINGGSSYVIGAWDKINSLSNYDLRWEDSESSRYSCEYCDNPIGEDDGCTAENSYGDSVTVCEDCCFTCDECDSTYTMNMRRNRNGDTLCITCRDTLVRQEAEQAEQAEHDEQVAQDEKEAIQAESEAC